MIVFIRWSLLIGATLLFACSSLLAQSLISVERFVQVRDSANFFLIDLRTPEAFAEGHIPSAHQVWRTDMQNLDAATNGLRASRAQMEQLLSKLGMQADQQLVIYDGKGNCDAARLWWVLKNYGFDRTQILDGGWLLWQKQSRPVSTDTPETTPSSFAFPAPQNDASYISLDEVHQALKNPKVVLLDTRTKEEYEGSKQKKGASQAGRIPGSKWWDWTFAIDYHGDKTLWPIRTLKEKLAEVGVDSSTIVITYCHSGVRSAHTTFVLREILGYANVRNYDGSWIEWSAQTDLPIETGPIIEEDPLPAEPETKPEESFNWRWIIGALLGLGAVAASVFVWVGKR